MADRLLRLLNGGGCYAQAFADDFAGKKLEAKGSAKYLGVILDRKLKWNENLEEKIRKFHAAFWLCGGTFGGGWGLKPKILV